MKTNVKPGKTPAKITVSMIDEDLNNGITKPEMAIKYGIKLWEVAEMFKHPFLKGRRPSKKKPLSFKFVDDITDAVDPNQVTLEDAITEATEEVETAVDRLADVNKAVVDMLGPTDPEQTIESLINEVKDTEEDLNPSFEKEEELEIGDDTFEL